MQEVAALKSRLVVNNLHLESFINALSILAQQVQQARDSSTLDDAARHSAGLTLIDEVLALNGLDPSEDWVAAIKDAAMTKASSVDMLSATKELIELHTAYHESFDDDMAQELLNNSNALQLALSYYLAASNLEMLAPIVTKYKLFYEQIYEISTNISAASQAIGAKVLEIFPESLDQFTLYLNSLTSQLNTIEASLALKDNAIDDCVTLLGTISYTATLLKKLNMDLVDYIIVLEKKAIALAAKAAEEAALAEGQAANSASAQDPNQNS